MAERERASAEFGSSPGAVAARLIFEARALKDNPEVEERALRSAFAEAAGAHASIVASVRHARSQGLATYDVEAARCLLITNFPLLEPYAGKLQQLYEAGHRGTELLDYADEAGCGWGIDAYGCWLELPVDDDGGRDPDAVHLTVEALGHI